MTDTNTTGPDAAADELGEVIIERIFDAPREIVFECMTKAEHLTHFWGPPGSARRSRTSRSTCGSAACSGPTW